MNQNSALFIVLELMMMVQKYQRKTEQASWDVTTMKLAMEEARKTSVNSAAKKYGINLSTLQRHIKKGSADKKLGRFTTVFTAEQESELLEYLFHMDNLFFGLTKSEFLALVYQYANANKISHPFKNNTAGEDWFKAFKKRHPDLTLRQPEPTSVARARGFNKPQVDRFFDLLEDQIDKHQVDVTRIYNVDETGIQTTSNRPPKVLTKTGKKQVGVISSVERGKLTTVICCCNAAGSFIPPFMIFGRKRMNARLIDGSPPGTVAACTDNGWISGPTFLEWLRHFVAMTRPTQDKKVILVMDNHVSHKYLPALEYASQNNVIFISLAPHTTHRTQPLDRCVYGPLKTYFEQSVSIFQRTHVGRIISQFDVAKLFGEAYLKAASPQNAIKGFQSTGIWPTNRHIFSDDEFLPSTLTDRPQESNACDVQPSTETVTDDLPSTSDNGRSQENYLNVLVPTESSIPHENSEPEILIDYPERVSVDSPQLPSQLRSSVNSDRTVSPSVLDQIIEYDNNKSRPSEEDLLSAIPECVTPTKVTPMDIRPTPKQIAPKTSRKRKIQKAEILTSTPIKEEQREIELKKQKVNQTRPNKRMARKNSNKIQPKASTSSIKKKISIGKKKTGKKEICFICHEIYEDPPREDWIKCDDCQGWAHEQCTAYSGIGAYYCDLCQE